MQGKRKTLTPKRILASLSGAVCHFEVKKGKRGGVLVAQGVVSIASFSNNEVALLTRGGRLYLLGEELFVSVLENRTVEIFGRIEEIRLDYGKS